MADHTIIGVNKERNEKIMALLGELDKETSEYVSAETGIISHPKKYYVKPEDATYADGVEIYSKASAEERETIQVGRIFRYRPWDGANAVANVLKDTFGYPGFGKGITTPFGGKIPPGRETVEVAVGQTIEVPWGQLEVPDMKAVWTLQSADDDDYGRLFRLSIELPKKYEKQARFLMNRVEKYLQENSIYKGKAITGGDKPEFIDLTRVDRKQFVYKKEVDHALEAEIWNPLRYPDLYEEDGQPLRWISLLAGGYGTGKTSAAMLTAKVAVENGWTFIQARPKTENRPGDDLQTVMGLAHIYAPAVVFYEDLDVIAGTPDQEVISGLLESFDGMRAKGHPVSVMMTTNHPENIHPGLIRAGRLHTYLVFGDLDAAALEHLIKVKVGEHQVDKDMDYNEVYQACTGYSPSFMALVIDLAKRYAFFEWTEQLRDEYLHSNKEATNAEVASHVTRMVAEENAERFSYKLSTNNMVDAALRLKEQWQLTMDNAENRPVPARLDNIFKEMVQKEMRHVISSTWNNGDDELLVVNEDHLAKVTSGKI